MTTLVKCACSVPFATMNLSEIGFSYYTAANTKYINRLNAAPDTGIQLSSIKPNIRKFVMRKNNKLHVLPTGLLCSMSHGFKNSALEFFI